MQAQSLQPDPAVRWVIHEAVETLEANAVLDSDDCRIPPDEKQLALWAEPVSEPVRILSVSTK